MVAAAPPLCSRDGGSRLFEGTAFNKKLVVQDIWVDVAQTENLGRHVHAPSAAASPSQSHYHLILSPLSFSLLSQWLRLRLRSDRQVWSMSKTFALAIPPQSPVPTPMKCNHNLKFDEKYNFRWSLHTTVRKACTNHGEALELQIINIRYQLLYI